jgi:hypothetical protein
MLQQTGVRLTLLIVAVVAIGIALVPTVNLTADGVNGPADLEGRRMFPEVQPGRTVITLGLTASPFFEFQSETQIVPEGASFKFTRSRGWQIRFFSWSTLALVMGFSLLYLLRTSSAARPAIPLPGKPSLDGSVAPQPEREQILPAEDTAR